MSHLWGKILGFFLEKEERLFVAYLFLLIDFEFNAPLPNRLEWVKEEREESKSKRGGVIPWVSMKYFLFLVFPMCKSPFRKILHGTLKWKRKNLEKIKMG